MDNQVRFVTKPSRMQPTPKIPGESPSDELCSWLSDHVTYTIEGKCFKDQQNRVKLPCRHYNYMIEVSCEVRWIITYFDKILMVGQRWVTVGQMPYLAHPWLRLWLCSIPMWPHGIFFIHIVDNLNLSLFTTMLFLID